jgi:hypothetical protein
VRQKFWMRLMDGRVKDSNDEPAMEVQDTPTSLAAGAY